MRDIALERQVSWSYDETLERLPALLKEEGFGVLTEIDVKATLKAKLDVDFRRFKILGACNPPFAHQALETDLHVSLLMPCNVVVYENDDGVTQVMAWNPLPTMEASGNPKLVELGKQLRSKLDAVLEKLG